jgi:hypothetical protein
MQPIEPLAFAVVLKPFDDPVAGRLSGGETAAGQLRPDLPDLRAVERDDPEPQLGRRVQQRLDLPGDAYRLGGAELALAATLLASVGRHRQPGHGGRAEALQAVGELAGRPGRLELALVEAAADEVAQSRVHAELTVERDDPLDRRAGPTQALEEPLEETLGELPALRGSEAFLDIGLQQVGQLILIAHQNDAARSMDDRD